MWELDHKKGWVPKNWWFWTVVLEKTLESPLDCKEIQPVHPKGDQSWVFIGRTDDEAETPILWLPEVENWLIGKDPDARKDWRQVEKEATENEMVDGITDSMGMNLTSSGRWCRTRKLGGAAVHGVVSIGHNWATEKQQRSKIKNKWDVHSHYIVSSLYHYTSTDCCILLRMWAIETLIHH